MDTGECYLRFGGKTMDFPIITTTSREQPSQYSRFLVSEFTRGQKPGPWDGHRFCHS